MQAMPSLGPLEIVFLLLFGGGGLGLPTGIPPDREDRLVANVAPAECLFYTSWAGTASPNAESGNHTERLLAEPQVQKFLEEVTRAMAGTIQQSLASGGPVDAERSALTAKVLKTFTTRGGAMFLTDLKFRAGQPLELHGGLLVNLGDAVAETRVNLERLQAENLKSEITTVEIDAEKFYRFLPEPDAPLFTWGTRGKYLIACFGDESIAAMLERMRGEPPAWLTKLRGRLPVPSVSNVSYVNLKKLVDLAVTQSDGANGEEVIRAFGLDKLIAFSTVSGLDEKGFVNRALLTTAGEPTGLLSLLETKPLSLADLQAVPQDTPAVAAFKLDPEAVLKLYFWVADHVDRDGRRQVKQQMTQQIADIEKQLGMNLRDDLLKPLGDTWRIYAVPSAANPVTGWVISVSLRDRQRFVQSHDRLLQLMSAPGGPTFTQSEIGGKKVYALTLPQPGALSPSWCLTESELLIAPSSKSIHAILSRQRVAASLATQPDVVPLFQGQPALLAVAFLDMKKIFETIYPLIQLALQEAAPQRDPNKPALPVWPELPATDVVAKHLQPSIHVVQRTADGIEFGARRTLPSGIVSLAAPTLLASLLPAAQAAREAAWRTASVHNLKQLMGALHNHHDTFGALPAACSVNKDGKALLSWRVHILPFMEQQVLYEKFHLDEPWDSEHNKKLIPQMPKIFRAPSSTAAAQKTNYLGVRGKGYMFVPAKNASPPGTGVLGTRLAEVLDGASGTITVVEANDESAVVWTKPDDFEPNEQDMQKGLLGLYPNGFHAAYADGSVRFVSQSVDKSVLKTMFTKAGGD